MTFRVLAFTICVCLAWFFFSLVMTVFFPGDPD